MRDCRDVIMLAKPGYIYIVRNGGKKYGREDRRREDRGGKKWREEEESRAGHLTFSPGWWVQPRLKVVFVSSNKTVGGIRTSR
jgi:hypothetical protein